MIDPGKPAYAEGDSPAHLACAVLELHVKGWCFDRVAIDKLRALGCVEGPRTNPKLSDGGTAVLEALTDAMREVLELIGVEA